MKNNIHFEFLKNVKKNTKGQNLKSKYISKNIIFTSSLCLKFIKEAKA